MLDGADDRYGRQPGHEGLMCEVRPSHIRPSLSTLADDKDPLDRSSTSTRSRSIKESESLLFRVISDSEEREYRIRRNMDQGRFGEDIMGGHRLAEGNQGDFRTPIRRSTGANNQGVGLGFGPDVTKRWCDLNKITAVIRSHEVRQDGYAIEHDGLCITTFSCPNYCDTTGNKVSPLYCLNYDRKMLMSGRLCPNAIGWSIVISSIRRCTPSSSQTDGLLVRI
jgi:hypothetical protein